MADVAHCCRMTGMLCPGNTYRRVALSYKHSWLCLKGGGRVGSTTRRSVLLLDGTLGRKNIAGNGDLIIRYCSLYPRSCTDRCRSTLLLPSFDKQSVSLGPEFCLSTLVSPATNAVHSVTIRDHYIWQQCLSADLHDYCQQSYTTTDSSLTRLLTAERL